MFDLILSQTKILDQIQDIWISGLLIFSRTLAFASTAPVIGHKGVPALVKISFSILLTLILMPLVSAPEEYPRGFKFIYLIVINVFIGMLIGWVSNLVLEIGKITGEMLDMQMGLNAATIFDIGNQSQSTIIGRFFDFLTLAIFVTIGGTEKVIEGFYKSYQTFPLVSYQLTYNVNKLIKATSDIIGIGFMIAAPIIILLLAVDLVLGLMSRAAPQINAFQISFSIKPYIGILFVLILLSAIFQILSNFLSEPMRFFY